MNKAHSKTPFDTNPVESLYGAIVSFTAAFDGLQKELAASGRDDLKNLADKLKETLYKPVYPRNETAPISIFEFGVMYVPGALQLEKPATCRRQQTNLEEVSFREENGGTYSVNGEKCSHALKTRASDIKALFTQCDGLICDMTVQLEKFPDCGCEKVTLAVNALLNECFRLRAMF